MKRFLTCLALIAAPFAANASPEMAKQWGSDASDLRERTAALISEIDMGGTPKIDDIYELDVYRFGRTSAGLAIWIHNSEGPKDLGCIFRGMAAESETQLETLEDMSDKLKSRESLRRLSTMFADAEMISSAAQRRTATPGLKSSTTQNSCPANLDSAMRALR